MKIYYIFCVAASLGVASSSYGQNLVAAEFEPLPAFTETFAGGATVGQWELDPANLAGAVPATYVTSTPSGVAPAVTTLDPVASSVDNGVMYQGNPSSTNGSLFGLNYMRCINSLANGSGEDFTLATFNKYRMVARIYLYSPAQIPDRWQVGPWVFNRPSLFRAGAFYNTNSLGGGPGFGYRGGTITNGPLPGTSALTAPRWTLMSVMVDHTDVDPANHRLSICVDANGDGLLDETDPLEYISLTLAADAEPGPFGIFTVGNANSDTFPLFTDTVQIFKPVLSDVADWTLY